MKQEALRKYQAIFGWIFVILLIAASIYSRKGTNTPEARILIAATGIVASLNIVLYAARLAMKYPAVRFPLYLLITLVLLCAAFYFARVF